MNGTYTSVGLNASGVLTGSPDKAATFTAGSGSRVELPAGIVSSTESLAVELWFKAGSGASGNLFAEQNSAQTVWNPMVYVGTDGKLRGMAPVTFSSGPIVAWAGTCADVQSA